MVRFMLATLTVALTASYASAATVRGSAPTKEAKDPLGRRSLQRNNQNMDSVNPNGAPYIPVGTKGIGVASVGEVTIVSNNGGGGESSTTTTTTTGGGSTGGETPVPGASGTCANEVYTDVVVIGAGASGVAAAATLEAQGVEYVILESTNRVGGRVRSHSFGVPTNSWTVEDGANWILEVAESPYMGLVETYGFTAPPQDFFDQLFFGEDGQTLDTTLVQNELDRFTTAWQGAAAEAGNMWGGRFSDNGAVALLADQGWTLGTDQIGDLDYALQWESLDWEYAASDTDVRYFPPSWVNSLLAADPRGFEYLVQQYFQTNSDPTRLVTSARVSRISYDENIQNGNGKTYKAKVTTTTSNGAPACTNYIAQRVISTVSTGVINNDLIQFSPPLAYGTNTNPYEMATFVKVFYQFSNKFWDDNEFIDTVRDLPHRGQCQKWQNMDVQMPGSNIIRCDLMTEAFEQLIDPTTKELTQATILSLLEPLRLVYGASVVGNPIDTYATKINKDADFGFGAYGNWKKGFTFDNLAQFYGIQQMTSYCQHNGCNAQGEWILHFSGAHVCYQYAETVNGAHFSGERSANYVLQELGYNVNPDNSPCDVNWQWLR